MLTDFFGWPNGVVWGNLLASIIWAAPSLFLIWRRNERNHQHILKSLHKLHTKVAAKK